MFDNNNKIFAYKISLKLDQYLVALFNLCYDVFLKIENITVNGDEVLIASKLFMTSFYDDLGINVNEYLEQEEGKYLSTKDEFFNNMAAILNYHYLKSKPFVSKLDNHKDYLYYFKDKFIIYSPLKVKREIENSLNDSFKSINIISDVINNLDNKNLKESIQSISTIYNFNKAGQYIKVLSTDVLKPQLFQIQADLLDFDLLEEEIYDFEYVWINQKHEITKDLSFDTTKDDYFLILNKETKQVLGLKVNNLILLKYDINISPFIKPEYKNLYLWQYFKENLLKQKKQTLLHDSPLITDFKDKSKEKEFNKLLCNLKYNLYIDREIKIKRKYKSFFQEFILVSKLDELSNFNFFLPDDKKEKELLGIYAENKIGSKYNLLHYLKHKDEKHFDSFINSNPQKIEKEKVNILKAELSFYLVEKYYEDIIEEILKDLRVDFLSNVELQIKGVSRAEFDFVIFSDNKFYFIEAKTTLSKDNVYETSRKYNEYIDHLKHVSKTDLSDFRFVLMGLLSNQNLDNYKHFFKSDTIAYNVNRKGFNIMPYKFSIPFFSHQKLELECIAEPELFKLKEFIKKICLI